jgi:hypothetical protein
MTMIIGHDVRCVCCGQTSKVRIVCSTHAFGSPDLDTRPPEENRSTIWANVYRCPGCGYCASDLSEGSGDLNSIVQSQDYRAHLENESWPAKANEFLCQALIAKHMDRLVDAASATLFAAWICDDSPSHREQAIACRQSALSLLLEAEQAGDEAFDNSETIRAMRVDLLRRSEDFSEARVAVDAMIAAVDSFRSILLFQKHLIETRDTAAHLVSEAFDFVKKADAGAN